MKVKCPIDGCYYAIWVEEGYFHYTKEEAIEKMLKHLKKHNVSELWELIERCVVEHFEKEMSGK